MPHCRRHKKPRQDRPPERVVVFQHDVPVLDYYVAYYAHLDPRRFQQRLAETDEHNLRRSIKGIASYADDARLEDYDAVLSDVRLPGEIERRYEGAEGAYWYRTRGVDSLASDALGGLEVCGVFQMDVPAIESLFRAPSFPSQFVGMCDGRRAWRPVAVADDTYVIRFDSLFSDDAPHRVALGRYTIQSPAPRSIDLRIDGEEGLIAWLNGTPVFTAELTDTFLPDGRPLRLDLVEGKNELLILCAHAFVGWSATVRFDRSPAP